MGDKIFVTRPSMPSYNEYIEEIKDIWDSHWLTNMGIKHKKLQSELRSYLKTENVELVTNGHMALELSIQALNLKGEVITTPFTFASTTHAIVRNGLRPVFCDIDPITFTIDTEKLENLITDKTSAILPVHVYGNICDIENINRIAKKYGLKVIYDSAHAFGVEYKGKGIASYGDVNCFSFHATKVFNSIEGGAVAYYDNDFGEKLYRLKNFGIKNEDVIEEIGVNAKMNEFCAAMGLCNLRHLDYEIERRKKIVECYRDNLKGVDGIQIKQTQKDVKDNYSYFPIVVDEEVFGTNRDEILYELQKNDIYSRKYFYPLTSTFNCFNNEYNSKLTPVALKISKRVLTLPLYADLEIKDVERICKIILSCKKK